ncbi:Uncharacterised protein [Vibrio cholerae]|nr:Uncharacterised protein [Vibrio cholerae]
MCATALGVPVEPEVKINVASCSPENWLETFSPPTDSSRSSGKLRRWALSAVISSSLSAQEGASQRCFGLCSA